MDLRRCNLGKFLVVHPFFARRPQVRQDAGAPSGESWNYLSGTLSCNIEVLTLSTSFRDLFLPTNLRQGASDTISLCVFKA